jgi:hypothetical protein
MTSARLSAQSLRARPMPQGWKAAPTGILVTEIGSLPLPNVDSAIETSFRCNVPFLPQLPIRRPEEFMLPQALDGFPGLKREQEGMVSVDLLSWRAKEAAWSKELKAAQKSGELEPYEPKPHASAAWQPFLWELEERAARFCKLELAGPLTCQWSVAIHGDPKPEEEAKIRAQIFELVLIRALAMIRKVRSLSVQPLFFFDEPALTVLSPDNPKHVIALKELKLALQALKKEGALSGVHCCGETAWAKLLETEPDVLSIDSGLSLLSLLRSGDALTQHLLRGGNLSLGIIPNTWEPARLLALEPSSLVDHFEMLLRSELKPKLDSETLEVLIEILTTQSMYTPACGLALQTPEEAEAVLGTLLRVQKEIEVRL